MTVVLRYVDKHGHIIERFLGIQHVTDTNSATLKASLDELFALHGLSMSRLRGQGYDGASNIQGEFNGLRTRIESVNKFAFYVHCFAHQLQLALVGVTNKHTEVGDFFVYVSKILNVVRTSCKRKDILLEKYYDTILNLLDKGEISSGRGLNQETSLRRHGDTRWGSHYLSLVCLMTMFFAVVESLEIVREDGVKSEQRTEAGVLLDKMCSFEFIFILHLMKNILGFSNELSQALQRKDQDIENTMHLVDISKKRLRNMRENAQWDSLLVEVTSFYLANKEYEIDVPNMSELYKASGRSRRGEVKTNLHHYRAELFYSIIDLQLTELDNRFNESNIDLLVCLASLSLRESFVSFNKEKLIRFAGFYQDEFSAVDLILLENELETYIMDVRSSREFSSLKEIVDLAEKMVKTRKSLVYPLVYLLMTLSPILPVGTATVEKVFSAMNIVKSRLRNRMADKWMNDSLIVYIEKELFVQISTDAIMRRFQTMKPRKQQLP